MSLKTASADFGKGLLAGFAGTLAITASQTVEAKIRNRPPSSSPADAAGKVLGVAPTGDAEKQRFSTIVHFGYGTAWGGVRGLLAAGGLRGRQADLVHFALVSGSAMLMLPGLKVAPRSKSGARRRSAPTPCTTWSTPSRPARPTTRSRARNPRKSHDDSAR